MLQVRSTDMFRTAYQQVSIAERTFVDQLVREIADSARRHGRSIALILDQPLPDAIHERDTRGWLQRPLIVAAITEQVQALALREEINLENTAREIHALAHSNMDDYFRVDAAGDPYFDLDGLSREQMAAIQSIEIEKSDGLTRSNKTKVKIRLHDKIAALKMELALMGIDDGDNPYRKADKAGRTPTLASDTTAEQAADNYASMIGDD